MGRLEAVREFFSPRDIGRVKDAELERHKITLELLSRQNKLTDRWLANDPCTSSLAT